MVQARISSGTDIISMSSGFTAESAANSDGLATTSSFAPTCSAFVHLSFETSFMTSGIYSAISVFPPQISSLRLSSIS